MNQQSQAPEAKPSHPRIFIASSKEGLSVAEAIQYNLEHDAEVTIWTQLVFHPSEFALESIERDLKGQDFAIFVFTPDDILQMRKTEFHVTRDNVIFELGLSVGQRGRLRNFIVMPRNITNFHIPTDLLGLNTLTYNDTRSDGNIAAALSPACYQIKNAIKRMGIYEGSEPGRGKGEQSTINQEKTNSTDGLGSDTTEPAKIPGMLWRSCAHFFHSRFQRSFPGLRVDSLDESDPEMIKQRLERLLHMPLAFPTTKNNFETPIWWLRGGEASPIESFEMTEDGRYLVGFWELEISRVVAVDLGAYWNCFVYIEASPLEASGVHPFNKEYIDRCASEMGYCYEEVALFRGTYIDRAFYDDGTAEINGKLVDLNGEAHIRLRPLSRFNFVIAGHDSSITNDEFSEDLTELLDNMLQGKADVNDLIKSTRKLPKTVGNYDFYETRESHINS